MESTSAEGRASEKKSPGMNLKPLAESERRHVFFKDGAGDGKVEPAAGQMRVRLADFGDQPALSRADVDQGLIVLPWKFLGDGFAGAHADTGHGLHETRQLGRIAIEDVKNVFPVFGFVLGEACFQAFGEIAPKSIQPGVHHGQETADIRGLGFIKIEVRLRRVGIETVLPFQHPQSHQRIKKIQGAPLVQPQALSQGFGIHRSCCQNRKDLEFDRAQQGLGSPECRA